VSPADSRSARPAGRGRSQGGPQSSVQPTRRGPDRFDVRRTALRAWEPARAGHRNGTRTVTSKQCARLPWACRSSSYRGIRVGSRQAPPRNSRRTEHARRNSHAGPCSSSSPSTPTPRRPPTASPRSPQGRENKAGAGNEDQSWQRLGRSCLDYHITHYTRPGRPRQSPVIDSGQAPPIDRYLG
jgi:hypothetical protein